MLFDLDIKYGFNLKIFKYIYFFINKLMKEKKWFKNIYFYSSRFVYKF